MDIYEAINEEKKIKLVITKDEGVTYYLLEVYQSGSDQVTDNALYYRLEDAFSAAHNKYGINKEKWMQEK
jgi:hypothetical protein